MYEKKRREKTFIVFFLVFDSTKEKKKVQISQMFVSLSPSI